MILHEALAKRDPTVNTRKFYERVYGASRRARHFVFDERASALIGSFIDQCTDLILKHRQFAKPPYDCTYIEYDAGAMFQGHHGKLPETDEFDRYIGYLIDGHNVYVVSSKNNNSHPVLWPMFYYVGDRGSHSIPPCPFPTMLYAGTDSIESLKNKIVTLLGSRIATGYEDKKDAAEFLHKELLDILYDNEMYWGGSATLTLERSQNVLNESIGDIRNIWAGLLWLQSVPKTVAYSGQTGGARLYKGKRIPASEHHIVSIHLKPKAVIRKVYLKGAAKRDSPRYHEVRGFYRHKGQRTGCSHEWPDAADKKHIFECKNCGLKRWWVKPHSRGDKSKGIITKDYAIDIEAKKEGG